MSKPLLTTEQKEITKKEDFIIDMISLSDVDRLKPFLQGVSMLWRALDGQPIEPEDVFAGMLNIKDIRERTRYSTILDLKKHVTLHLIGDTYPIFASFKRWAIQEEHHFISYPKGEGRKEGVEIMKAKGMIAHGISPIFLGEIPQPKPKGRFSRLRNTMRKSETEINE